jgi:hypothetical protein
MPEQLRKIMFEKPHNCQAGVGWGMFLGGGGDVLGGWGGNVTTRYMYEQIEHGQG